MKWHLALACAFDKIIWIHRNAMPPDATTGIMRQKCKRFRGRAIDDMEDIDPPFFKGDRQLVNKGDIHVTKGVFDHFDSLGLCDRTHFLYGPLGEQAPIERTGLFRTLTIHPSDHTRKIPHTPMVVPGIDTFRTMGKKQFTS